MQEEKTPPSSSPTLGDMAKRAAVGAIVFTVVTAVAGPIVGAAAASLASGGEGGE